MGYSLKQIQNLYDPISVEEDQRKDVFFNSKFSIVPEVTLGLNLCKQVCKQLGGDLNLFQSN